MFDTTAQLNVFSTDLQLRRIDRARNMRRYYRMSVQPDLFGGACLVCEGGGSGFGGRC